MNFAEYCREAELILRQTPAECALYPLIDGFLREFPKIGKLSLRCIALYQAKQVWEPEKLMFPMGKDGKLAALDFAILPLDFDYKKTPKGLLPGAVEVKAIYTDLETELHKKPGQITGGLSRFRRIIYTNGLEWRVYEKSSPGSCKSVSLGEYTDKSGGSVRKGRKYSPSSSDKILWSGEEKWQELRRMIEGINWEEQK